MLNKVNKNTIPSCSKAPRGLFVLPQVNGIFTVIANSPSSSLRQFPSRYSFQAGLNLPDKEFRYLRTIIVIADVHWRFGQSAFTAAVNVPALVRSHPLYILLVKLAESCVFDKQSLGIFSCGLHCCRQTLFQSYGRCFAEFLNEDSLVHLGLLDLPTCVGLRYGLQRIPQSGHSQFSRQLGSQPLLFPKKELHALFDRTDLGIFLQVKSTKHKRSKP